MEPKEICEDIERLIHIIVTEMGFSDYEIINYLLMTKNVTFRINLKL